MNRQESIFLYVVPQGFDAQRTGVRGLSYLLELCRGQAPDSVVQGIEKRIEQVKNDTPRVASTALWDSPLD